MLVTGEAGVGETRLLAELAALAAARGPRVLTGRAVEDSGPYRAVADAGDCLSHMYAGPAGPGPACTLRDGVGDSAFTGHDIRLAGIGVLQGGGSAVLSCLKPGPPNVLSMSSPADSSKEGIEMRTCPARGSTQLETPVMRPASAVQRSTAASEVSQLQVRRADVVALLGAVDRLVQVSRVESLRVVQGPVSPGFLAGTMTIHQGRDPR